jgi:MtrB/PioB family decaheme-associated outer membrane protein
MNMNISTRNTSSLALAIALSLSAGLTQAAQLDTSNWKCANCVFPEGVQGSVELGGYSVSDTSARFGDYTGLDEKGGYALANALIDWWGKDGMWFSLDGRELGLDSRSLVAAGGLQGLFKLEVFLQEIPRRFYDDTVSPLAETGLGELGLPDGFIRGADTGSMSNLASSLAPVSLGYDRENQGLEFTLTPYRNWSFDADYRQEKRDGNRRNWGNFLTFSTEFAQPMSYTTEEYTAGVTYSKEKWYLRAEYYGSTFDSGYAGITWDNPYSTASETGQKALSPDNTYYQGSVSASYQFDTWRTLVSTRLSAGTMEQTAGYLAYTVNPMLVTGPLPRVNLGGKVDTTNVNVKVNTSPMNELRLTAEYRMDERDNNTPVESYQGVGADSVPLPAPVSNSPYSFKREDMKLKGAYRISGVGSFQAGYDYSSFERDLQERDKTETDKIWATLQVRPGNTLDGFLTVATEKRRGDDYQVLVNQAPQNPLMRKYNMADRDRDSVRLQLSYQPMDMLQLGVSGEYSQDEYKKSTMGLTDSDYANVTVDGTVVLPANSTLYLMYSHDNIQSTEVGSQGFDQPNWSADVNDTFDTAVVGITVPAIKDVLDLRLDYTYSDSSSRTNMETLVSSSRYPDQTAKMDMVKLYLDYKYSDRLTLSGGYWYEKYDSADWSLDSVYPTTIYNVLSMGAQPQAYDQAVAWVSFTYAFGWQPPKDE